MPPKYKLCIDVQLLFYILILKKIFNKRYNETKKI